MRRILLGLVTIFIISNLALADKCHPPKPSKNPTADELMKAWFDIKFTRYARDYGSVGEVIYIDKTGLKRKKKWMRRRIILHGKRGFDYKDVIIITYPEYTKGLAVLTWAYLDVKKQNDIWLWLPS